MRGNLAQGINRAEVYTSTPQTKANTLNRKLEMAPKKIPSASLPLGSLYSTPRKSAVSGSKVEGKSEGWLKGSARRGEKPPRCQSFSEPSFWAHVGELSETQLDSFIQNLEIYQLKKFGQEAEELRNLESPGSPDLSEIQKELDDIEKLLKASSL